MASSAGPVPQQATGPVRLPRVVIRFCTQCKWMLRAAYFAQELLSTFGPALGEVALQPATGGVFTVTLEAAATAATAATDSAPAIVTLWDRKAEGGFPETKELKRRVRDVIEPGRDLGHVDRDHARGVAAAETAAAPASNNDGNNDGGSGSGSGGGSTAPVCEDCQ